ncbi:NADPH oxidase family protein [Aspergillus affinis]|uniref:NADPH oxidase family protein n=1 Tax=Aspergillus affinis TaxID=1070780 RepID=UPI0022FDCE90|nr:uncharacterized protein KD926_008959 [Aspergillus affinis]KAI9039858.1 hypothetical protein KD926_008959 [Aspergillus affinis]
MRLGSFIQAHPFSVAWWNAPELSCRAHRAPDSELLNDLNTLYKGANLPSSNDENDGPFVIWLIVQAQWGLTKQLASYGSYTNLRAIIDGPYGCPPRLERFGHVVMFTQGIGIAAQMPYIRESFYGSLGGRFPIRRLSLIWETNEEELSMVKQWIEHMLREDHDNHSKTMMLDFQLYVVNGDMNLRYGRRVRRFASTIHIESVLIEELQGRRGKMLITASAGSRFVDSLRRCVLDQIKRGHLEKEIEFLCLDFQPPEAPSQVRG